MHEVTRNAIATWHGSISDGEGLVSASSGAFGRLPISWQLRTADWDGQTSPEELLATAFGASYVMALATVLSERDALPAELNLEVSCTSQGDDTIAEIAARVTGNVPGYARNDLEAVAAAALERCAVAKAMRGNISIVIEGGNHTRR
jgi:osmotically inducible protein OsmC